MYPMYSFLIFLAILGLFLTFIWLVKRTVDQVSFQLTLEPQPVNHYRWNSIGKVFPSINRRSDMADISRYYNSTINEEELRLMDEIDKIKNENELKEWFKILKAGYKHKNIPKRVYLRVSTMLNGYVWFNEEEYIQRTQAGKPVHKVTKREYALEKKLENLAARGSLGKKM